MILENLPPWVQSGLPVFALLLVGILVEKRYVRRVATFTNAIALNVHFLSIDTVGFWLGTYADLAFILGGYGLLAYTLDEELTTNYYEFNLLFYSGLTVGLVILLPSNWFIIALLGGVVSNFLLYLWAESALLKPSISDRFQAACCIQRANSSTDERGNYTPVIGPMRFQSGPLVRGGPVS